MLKYWVIAWLVDVSSNANGRLAVWGGKAWIKTDYVGPEAMAMLAFNWKPSSHPYGYINKRNARDCARRLAERHSGIIRAIAIIPANHPKHEPIGVPESLSIARGIMLPHGGGGDL